MSCEYCSKAQEKESIVYYRWKNADIAMSGCDEHLKQIFGILSVAQGIDDIAEEIKQGEGAIER